MLQFLQSSLDSFVPLRHYLQMLTKPTFLLLPSPHVAGMFSIPIQCFSRLNCCYLLQPTFNPPLKYGMHACALAAIIATLSLGLTKNFWPSTMLRSPSPSEAAPSTAALSLHCSSTCRCGSTQHTHAFSTGGDQDVAGGKVQRRPAAYIC